MTINWKVMSMLRIDGTLPFKVAFIFTLMTLEKCMNQPLLSPAMLKY